MEIKSSLFYELTVTVFKQHLPKQCFICRKTPDPMDLYFGDFQLTIFVSLYLEGTYIRREGL